VRSPLSEIIISVRRAARVFPPLDEQWALKASVYSDEMAQRMVWLSAIVPYAQGEAIFARIGEQAIPSTSIWRQTQRHGSRLATALAEQRATVDPVGVDELPAEADHENPKGVSLDGGMVNTREEGWREFKVGVVFDIATRFERHPTRGHLVKMAHGVNIHYTAVLGSKTEFEPRLGTWPGNIASPQPRAKRSLPMKRPGFERVSIIFSRRLTA
jgi:hypothetical protein